jgi:hypothetical protein
MTDISVREGRSGLGIYVTQEERITDSREELVGVRRHVMALFPAARVADGQTAAGGS